MNKLKNISSVLIFFIIFTEIFVFSAYSITTKEFMYTDINGKKYVDISYHWAKKQITDLIISGVLKGVLQENETYKIYPQNYITLAEYVVLMEQAVGLAEDIDNHSSKEKMLDRKWYKIPMEIANRNNFFKGIPQKYIIPENPVSRSVIAQITANALNWTIDIIPDTIEPYSDISKDNWFYNSIVLSKENKIIAGYPDGMFKPLNTITRAEAFTIINNSINLYLNRPLTKGNIVIKDEIIYKNLYLSNNFYNDSLKIIADWQLKYPEIIKTTVIGKSVAGRNLTIYKIGNGKNKIFINAEHHPREYITSTLVINQMGYILNAYDEDISIIGMNIKKLLEDVTFCFMPFVNPDGLVACLDGKLTMYTNAHNVDINSNYDANWDTHKTIANYNGMYAFSEPETRAIRDLCLSEEFSVSVAYHSAGEVIYWDFGQKGEDLKRDKYLVNIIKNVTGYKLSTPLPGSIGMGFKDWVIQKQKKSAFTIEVGKGAITKPVNPDEYDIIVDRNLDIPLYLAKEINAINK